MSIVLQIENLDIVEFKMILKEVISEELQQIKELLKMQTEISDINISEKLLSMKAAAQFLQITTVTLYKYIKEGNIKAYHVGKRRKFKKSDLDNYLINSKIKHRY